ncbi:rod-binding protein [Salidesulfovibrio onnuriiensis]|uniref:rod-binding protein n=1 Tax=Salidesulfovibrio onnuriiensis TaxID=2583823 RepID=UPI0011CC2D7C|nr:rod-binding protein [Salidesulfovibrio onnuriiensis]
MVTTGLEAQAAVNKAESNDLVKFKVKMDGLKKRLAVGDVKERQLKKACQDFEAVFISKLWKQMQATVPKNEIFGGKQSEMYMSMFDRDFAEKMAESGGIGLGDMMFEQLRDKLKEASRNALADKVEIKPLRTGGEGIPLDLAERGVRPLNDAAKRNRTIDEWLAEEKGTSAKVSTQQVAENEEPRALNDIEVKARLEALTRRIEERQRLSMLEDES